MSINVVSFSSSGGAGNVAKTLVFGFSKIGVNAKLITATSSNLRTHPLVSPSLTLSAVEDAYLHKSPSWKSLISLSRDKHSVLDEKLPASELTIFRWMNGILGQSFLEANPELGNLVWGLDDMNPFTGACHYSGLCRGFESDCVGCPAVRKTFASKVEINLERKINFAARHKPTYVAPTDWIQGEFSRSQLGQGKESRKILNPLQPGFFESQEQATQRSSHLKVLIVAANLDDPTKGVWDVKESLKRFLENPNVKLKMIGRYSKNLALSMQGADFTGPLDSSSVMQQMREHDVLLVPSLFENAGTVVAEGASQALPTIAREVGGMPEMTNYGQTGYLFKTKEELDEILDSLSLRELSSKSLSAKEWAQQLKPELIAAEYAEAFLK